MLVYKIILVRKGENMKIGNAITKIRKEKNLSQEAFAELINVSRQTISNWENERSYPDLAVIVDISDKLDISLDQILKEDKRIVNEIDKKVKMGKKMKVILIGIILFIVVSMLFLGIMKYQKYQKAQKDKERYNEILNNIKELGFNEKDGIGFYIIEEDGIIYKVYGKMPEALSQNVSASTKVWSDDEAIMVDYDGKRAAVTYVNENVTTVYLDATGKVLKDKQSKNNNQIYNKYKDKTINVVKRTVQLFNEFYK